MAIYHLTIKILKRKDGKNVVAAAAYRRAARMIDHNTGQQWNYEKKPNVIYSEILVPENAPSWATALLSSDKKTGHLFSEKLWNMVEAREKRGDSQLAREIELALPIELTQQKSIALAQEFIRDQFVKKGMIADFSIHWDDGNPHVHVLLTTRELTAEGLGKKVRAWNERDLSKEWRREWADYANYHLKLNGHDVMIDHRSYKDQGINLIPSKHQGKAVTDMERRGIKTEIAEEANEIRKENLKIILEKPEILIDKTSRQKNTFSEKDLIHDLGKYINDKNQFDHKQEMNAAASDEIVTSVLVESENVLSSAQSHTVNQNNPASQNGTVSSVSQSQAAGASPQTVSVSVSPQTIKSPANNLGSGSTLSPATGVTRTNVPSLSVAGSSLSSSNASASSTGILSSQILAQMDAEEGLDKAALPVISVAQIEKILKEIEHFDAVFKEEALAKALLPYTNNAADFAKALLQIKQSPSLIALGLGEDGRERFTTRRMFEIENKIQRIGEKLSQKNHRPIEKVNTKKLLKAYESETGKTLTPEQKEAVKHLMGKKALRCLVGRAGTGKSFTLGAARHVWEASGLKVRGVALSGVAAKNLAVSAGIASSTIEGFRYRLKKGRIVLSSRDVIVMDEAGMTDSFSMIEILEAVHQAGAKLVLVGDPQQLQPVGPGVSFRAILEKTGFAELQEIYRQKIQWQRDATALLAKGQADQGIELYNRHHCVHLKKDSVIAMSTLLKDWEKLQALQDVSALLVLTHRNEDVRQLNTFIRQILVDKKSLSEGFAVKTQHQTINLSKGDRLLLTKTNDSLGVNNGDFGTVTQIEFTETGKVLHFTIKLDNTHKEITINPATYNHFDYGYCATVHKAQGLTVDHVLVYANSYGWDRHLSYVAMSRHRESCKLYASHDTYKDISDLKKSLNSESLKDSVMDYPVHFARRRSIEPQALQEITVSTKLAERLKALTSHLKGSIEQVIFPRRYWAKKQQEAIKQQSTEDTLQRREDARLVATYVDANKAIGIAFEAYQTKAASLGIAAQSKVLTQDLQKLLAQLEEHKALQSAISERDAIANKIYKESGRYTRALEIYQIPISTLEKQSRAHLFREDLKVYQLLHESNKTVLRDRLAFYLVSQMKTHYGIVKEAGLDTKLLRSHAISHERRVLLKGMGLSERENFYRVEKYKSLSQQAGKLMKTLMSIQNQPAGSASLALVPVSAVTADPKNEPDLYRQQQRERYEAKMSNHYIKLINAKGTDEEAKRTYIQHLNQTLGKFIQERNALASEIHTNTAGCEPALKFYEYGEARLTPGFDKLSPQSSQYAQARWFKLSSYAASHVIAQRIENYRHEKDSLIRQQQAYEILKEPNGYGIYYPALLQTGAPVNDFWKQIRHDAKAYERRQFLASLTSQEKQDFILVESYVKERQAAAIAWKEIFTAKDNLRLTTDEMFQKLQPFVKPYENLRNALGAEIYKDAPRFDKQLKFFNVDVKSLEKGSNKHYYRENVLFYAQAADRIERGRLAKIIVSEPKAHYSDMLESKVEWKSLYNDIRIVEKYDLFKGLSSDEKQLLRLADQYQKFKRRYAKVIKKVMQQKASPKKVIDPNTQKLADILCAKRNWLAERLFEKQDTLKLEQLFEASKNVLGLAALQSKKWLDWTKIEAQAETHRARLLTVDLWQEEKLKGEKLLEKVFTLTGQSKEQSYRDFQLLHKDMEKTFKRLYYKPDVHSEALRLRGESPESLSQWKDTVDQSKKLMADWYAQQKLEKELNQKALQDAAQQKRIQKARQIARQTQPIQGTLAERYLRDHRGIQGKLPSSLRFHPGYYNHLSGKKTPALVVLARNSQKAIQAVQIISLDPLTANKAFGKQSKITFGVIENAGVLMNQGDAKQPVIIAEGPETALSVAQAMSHHTVYAALGSGNFARMPLENEVKNIIFAADNDEKEAKSVKQLEEAAHKLSLQGIDVSQAMPEKPQDKNKWDFNDLLKSEGIAAIKKAFEKGSLLKEAILQEAIEKYGKEFTENYSKQEPVREFAHNPAKNMQEEKRLEMLKSKVSAIQDGLSSKEFLAKKVLEAMAVSYANALIPNDKQNQILITEKESEVNLLNEKVYECLRRSRKLTSDFCVHTHYGLRRYCKQGQVRFGKAVPDKNIKENTLGKIVSMYGANLTIELENQEQVKINVDKYKHLDYGYAMTYEQSKKQKFDIYHVYLTQRINIEKIMPILKKGKELQCYWREAEFVDVNALRKTINEKLDAFLAPNRSPKKENTLDLDYDLEI